MNELKKYLVWANKEEKIVRYASFTIMAKNEKDAEKKIKEELEGSCLAERLRLDNESTEKTEGDIGVFAEEIDEFNKDEAIKAEEIEVFEEVS